MYDNARQMMDAQQALRGGIIGAGEAKTARQPEVAEEMDRLSKAADEFGMIAEKMCARLVPVRRRIGELQGTGNAGTAPEPVLCGVASGLRAIRQRIDANTAMLSSALSELEI